MASMIGCRRIALSRSDPEVRVRVLSQKRGFSGWRERFCFWQFFSFLGVTALEVVMSDEKVRSEEFQFNGDMLVAKIKELIHAGNIRRIIIKNEDGRTLIDIPLTLGVFGALLAPQLAAIGAIAALVTHGTIVVEKME
jgi:hypothetical protein